MPTQPKQLRLKGWLELELLREKISESESIDAIIQNLYSYLALIYSEKNWDNLGWEEVAQLFYDGYEKNSPTIAFPMLVRGTSGKATKFPWDYENRIWYVWANTLAVKYGWSLEYIAELPINDALGLMQEILTDDHLKREWSWNLSEITYSYNPDTKTSKHQEYPWPSWMLPEPQVIKTTKILKSLLPVGLIIGSDSNAKH
jgi:hypothetical protein